MPLAQLLSHFLSLPSLPTSRFCFFRCWFAGEWFCVHFRTLQASPSDSHVRLVVSSTATKPPRPRYFAAGCFESLVFHTETLGFSVCLALLLFLLAYLHGIVGSPVWSATLPCVLLPRMSISSPPIGLDESFFNSLVVGLPCKCFFGTSGCSLFLDWLLSFFWLCEEVKHFLLLLHLSQNSCY